MATPRIPGFNPHGQGAFSRLRATAPFETLFVMGKTLIERIDERLKILGISGEEAARKAGLHRDTVRDVRRGKRKSLSAPNLAALAEALGTNASWLLGTEASRDETQEQVQELGLQYGGVVEAGAFRPQNMMDQDAERILIPIAPDPRFPARHQHCFRVVGNSMDKARIFEGMYVVALDVYVWEQQFGEIEDDKLVVVSRRPVGDTIRELTVKRLRLFRDRVELRPESSDSSHETYTFPLPTVENDEAQIEVIAVVLNATWLFK